MNHLMLNDILNLSSEEIKISKIEFNMNAGQRGEPFIDRWLRCDDIDKESGICSECSYWNKYGNQRNYRKGQIAFSFARLTGSDWLFISAGKVESAPNDTWASVQIIEKYKPFFGRMIITCPKGNTYSRYVFNMKQYINNAIVKEILPCLYSGEQFEGYDKVHIPYSRLKGIFEHKMLPSYYDALSKITGVYCLTDTKTGKLYIGSATGEGGIAQRWGNYLDSKHGGNKKLIDLYKKEGGRYFEEYFEFNLLEYFGISYDPAKVVEREQYWKRCLDTIAHGYNDN